MLTNIYNDLAKVLTNNIALNNGLCVLRNDHINSVASPAIQSRNAKFKLLIFLISLEIVFTINEHENICMAGLNRRAC